MGFSLVEVMVATALLATSISMSAQLFVISASNTVVARRSTVAAIAAAQKVEELRGNSAGPASVGALDYLGPQGESLGGGPEAAGGAAYIRRWFVERVPQSSMMLIEVVVTRCHGAPASLATAAPREPGEARLITLARQEP
jgi:prepilin-type N-terminal cleavage/methylation domain-containing protein